MPPISVPTPRPLPSGVSAYGLNELYEVEIFNFTSYRAKFGQDPPWDPSLPIKTWFDSTKADADPDDVAIYTTLKTSLDIRTGAVQIIEPCVFGQLHTPWGGIMTAKQAATVNLWGGAAQFLPYVIATTPATITDSSGVVSGVNPRMLSTSAQAETLNAALGGSGVKIFSFTAGPGNIQINMNGDPRNYFYFVDSNGQFQYVGILVENQNANGVGAPGKWTNIPQGDGVSTWTWIPSAIQSAPPPNTPVCAIPMRTLYAGESFSYPMAGQPMIVYTPPSAG